MATQPPKECFGKSWDGNNVLCAGGLDAAYIHPKTGSNQRERCAWFDPCATRVNATRMGQQQQIIPLSQVMRQQQQHTQPTSPWAPMRNLMTKLSHQPQMPQMPQMPQQQPQQFMQQVAVHPQQQQQMYYQQPQQQMQMAPQMVHPQMAMMPHASPMNYQWQGSQMPGYLTIPEPVVSGQHWGVRLFYNVARSMAKAGMHTGANFFDHSPINPFPAHPMVPPNGVPNQ